MGAGRSRLLGGLVVLLLACTAAEAPAPQTAPQDASLPCNPAAHHECIDDAHGVFVDGEGGDDAQPGTRARPVRTFARALALQPHAIFVCATRYPERVLAVASTPLIVLGGLHCGTFAWTGEKPTLYGLDFAGDGYVGDLRVEASVDAEHAPDAVGIEALGGSLIVERVDIIVGAGQTGKDGQLVTGPDFPPVSALNGGNAVGATPGPGGVSTQCQFQNMSGGAGGIPGADGDGGGYKSGTPGLHAACIGAGDPGGSGPDGKDGVDGTDGRPDGDFGDSGRAGGGGGGGDVGAGGGGGAGGCLGRPGRGGQRGGTSVGIAVDRPRVVLRETHIAVSDGGSGGSGHAGSAGMSGGEGGLGSGDGCKGGAGGRGGLGGAGSGAPGGSSASILWNFAIMWDDQRSGSLAADADSNTTLSHGSAGAGGAGGKPSMPVAPDGLAGDSVVIPRGPPPQE